MVVARIGVTVRILVHVMDWLLIVVLRNGGSVVWIDHMLSSIIAVMMGCTVPTIALNRVAMLLNGVFLPGLRGCFSLLSGSSCGLLVLLLLLSLLVRGKVCLVISPVVISLLDLLVLLLILGLSGLVGSWLRLFWGVRVDTFLFNVVNGFAVSMISGISVLVVMDWSGHDGLFMNDVMGSVMSDDRLRIVFIDSDVVTMSVESLSHLLDHMINIFVTMVGWIQDEIVGLLDFLHLALMLHDGSLLFTEHLLLLFLGAPGILLLMGMEERLDLELVVVELQLIFAHIGVLASELGISKISLLLFGQSIM